MRAPSPVKVSVESLTITRTVSCAGWSASGRYTCSCVAAGSNPEILFLKPLKINSSNLIP